MNRYALLNDLCLNNKKTPIQMTRNLSALKAKSIKLMLLLALFFAVALVNAQVTVTKSELNNLTSKQVDQPFTYVINYSTPNTSTAYTNLSICDPLPQGLIFLGVSSATGDMQSLSYNASTNSVCAVFNSPWNGGTGQFQIVVKFASTVFNGTVASNTAAVSSDQYNGTSNTVNITAISINPPPILTTGVKITKSAYNPNVLNNSLVLYGLDYGIGGSNPVSGFTVVDPLPSGFIPTQLQGASFPGTNVQFNMYYKTNVNSSYTLFPGSPYNTYSGVYETVNFLPANVRITEIKVEYPALPAGALFTQENFRSLDINGYFDNSIANLANNANFQNCGTITATGTGSGTATSCVTQKYLTGSRLDVGVGKNRSTWNNDLEPGGTYRYYVNVGDGYSNSADIINPVVADLLPPEFIYVGNATITGNGFTSAGSPAPVVTTIPNFNGTGRTLVRWAWGASNPLTIVRSGPAKYVNISFDIQVRSVPTGTYQNDAFISVQGTPYTWSSLNVVPIPMIDTFDFDGDGNKTETIAHSYVPFNVVNPSGAALVSEKWVKGSLDAGYSRYPASGRTTPGGIADYKLKLKNAGTVALKNIKVIDIFPYVGDIGVVDLSARGSQWQPFFVGPVVAPAGATVYYSTSTNPCRTDINFTAPGCDAGAVWTTTLPADITTVHSIKLDLGSVILQPNDSLEFNWPMRAPIDAPTNGEIAWNSFGYTATRNDNNSVLPSSEPIKVGISVNPQQPATLGNYVWYDSNGDGLQNEPTSNGINGVKVDLYWAKGGSPNMATDSLVSFTYTSSNAGNPGYYLFPVLNPGNYYVVFHKPLSNLIITTPNVGADDTIDSDGSQIIVSGDTLAITTITNLVVAETDLTWDLGLSPACTKPNAGINQTRCQAAGIATLTGTAPTTGIWVAQAGNPSGASVGATASGVAIVTFTSAAIGSFNFIYKNGSCTDTMAIIINAKPNAGIDQTVCQNFTATMSATTTGTWTAQTGNPSIAIITTPSSATTTITSLTTTGVYNFIWTNAAGCADTASVIVKTTSSSTTNTAVCSNLMPYLWNGLTFNAAGTQTKTGLINAVGCDSSATLNLTVKTNTTSTTNVSICSS
ncbi:MAG: SdrD B-like domain-containing protein, partial [Dolichospermum sp.]